MVPNAQNDVVNQPDVIWRTPSSDEYGSMPLGNGEVAINLWTEGGRDLCIYIARTDAWDGDGRLCKLGRVRVRLPEGSFAADVPFLQRLDLETATVHIRTDALAIQAWVDAHAPVVRLVITGRADFQLAVTAESWRRDRVIDDPEELASFVRQAVPFETAHETPDDILQPGGDAIAWCHHNRHSTWAANLGHQYLDAWARDHAADDPLIHRTFGCLISGADLHRVGGLTLAGEGRKSYNIAVVTACEQVPRPDDLLAALRLVRTDRDNARSAHEAWWAAFWQRSWIRITGDAAADAVTQGYALQRYLFACSGRGRFPIKFNGSLFTVAGRHKGRTFTPDFRRWGGAYWFQNTRLAYWPLVMAGDGDMVEPLFAMYRDCLPLARARTQAHHALPGVVMPETITFWGSWGSSDFGYADQRAACLAGNPEKPDHHPLSGPKDRHALCGYLRRHFTGSIELIALGLDLHEIRPNIAWLHGTLLPLAREYLAFFAAYWPERDADGRMVIAPAMALETWQDSAQPLPEIAGLGWVLDRLLALPSNQLTEEDRSAWTTMRRALPRIPQRRHHWKSFSYLLPAERYDLNFNCENPELYAIFPYRCFGVGKPDLQIGLETWTRRLNKNGAMGWSQDPIQAALLGLGQEARAMVVHGATTCDANSRFPAFWGPNFDWTPDQDHGGVLMLAVQRMVMQAESRRVDLLPAWPTGWDVEFRLHAPGARVVEGRFCSGVWEHLSGLDGLVVECHQPQGLT
jgi:alpha-L-fucosidase 2